MEIDTKENGVMKSVASGFGSEGLKSEELKEKKWQWESTKIKA
jgi:hypothetical protein